MKSTATGMSVSCSGVAVSVNGIVTSGPSGITENATKAGITASTGASTKTTLSAAFGVMSSLSASFTPSARLCSRPKGPCMFGPIRCCMRATTRRSHQMLNSVSSDEHDEDQHGLEDHDPHGVVAEARSMSSRGAASRLSAVIRAGRDASSDRRPVAGQRDDGLRTGAEVAGEVDAAEAVGAQTTSSSRSATPAGEHDRAGPVDSCTGSPTASAERGERRLADQRDRGRSAGVVGRVAVLHRAVADHRLPRRRAGTPRRWSAASSRPLEPAASLGSAARAPSQAPSSSSSAAAPSGVRKPSGRPSSSAIPASTRTSGTALLLGEHLRERPDAALPGRRSCRTSPRPARPGGRRRRARSPRSRRSSRLTTKPAACDGGPGSGGVGEVVELDTADHQGAELAGGRGGEDRRRRRGRAVAGTSAPQTAPTSTRAAASATGRPPGSRPPRQPASSAPRSPARRGTQASRAPVWSASAAAAASAPGTVASRSPTRMTPPPSRRELAVVARAPRWRPPRRPGGAGRRVASSLVRPRVVNGATAKIRGPLPRDGLAQPQEQRAGLLLGLEPEQDDGALAGSRDS